MRTFFGLVLIGSVAVCHGNARADELAVPAPTAAAITNGFSNEAWAGLIRATILAAMPEKKVQDKHWGHKSEVFSRYEIKTKGGQIKVRPRTKEVNHGFWQRHTVKMLDPGQTLKVDLDDVRRTDDGLTFAMRVVLKSRVTTEFEHWVYGVKGLNGQVEADVTIAADLDCSIDLNTITKEGDLLPSVQLVPTLNALHLKVRDIDARKVGVLGGWAAEEIGDNSRSTVNTILHESEDSILKDIRKQIVKKQDQFTISPGALLSLGKTSTEKSKAEK